jgi:hypothetical protein
VIADKRQCNVRTTDYLDKIGTISVAIPRSATLIRVPLRRHHGVLILQSILVFNQTNCTVSNNKSFVAYIRRIY